jgi:hypothetical protein
MRAGGGIGDQAVSHGPTVRAVLPRAGRRKTGTGQRIGVGYGVLKPSVYAPLPLLATTTYR